MGSEHRPTGINPGSAPKQNPSEEKSEGKSQQGKADKGNSEKQGKGNGDKGDKPAVKQTTKAPIKPASKNWLGFPFNYVCSCSRSMLEMIKWTINQLIYSLHTQHVLEFLILKVFIVLNDFGELFFNLRLKN